MNISRRGFLAGLLGAAGAAALDPEQLLWVPGEKKIFIPSLIVKQEPTYQWMMISASRDPDKGWQLASKYIMQHRLPSDRDPAFAGHSFEFESSRYQLVEIEGEIPEGGALVQRCGVNKVKELKLDELTDLSDINKIAGVVVGTKLPI